MLKTAFLLCALLAADAVPGLGQIPDKFTNLKYLPHDITRDSLTQVMRGFSFALGVRCQYCHTGGDGVSFEGVKFDSDDKPAKRKARYMLEMVDKINGQLLAGIEPKADPSVRVQCVTCHRGSALPKTLEQVLMETIRKDGVAAAVKQYKDLRQSPATVTAGRFDFGEWSVNETARKLVAQGDTTAAIALFEMNLEYYPQSAPVNGFLGELYQKKGNRAKAIEHFEKAAALQPNNPEFRRRLDALRR